MSRAPGSPLKLLFVVKSLAAQAGGAERVLATVAGELAARGHLVTVLSFDPPHRADFYPLARSVRRIRLGIGNPGKPSRIAETLARVVALRREAKKLSPDVAIGFMHSAYLPLGAALAGTGLAVIASEHIVFDHYAQRRLEKLLLRLSAPMFAAFTGISPAVRASFPRAIRKRMAVIPNPVAAAPAKPLDSVGRGRKRILTIGRLADQKDHRTLIDAFAILAPGFPDWDLRIVGEGELREELQAKIDGLGLDDRIDLSGTTPDVDSEYAAAQLFVISSTYESFGLATAEALASGLPAVGFADCLGTNEVIRHGTNGLLVSGAPRERALADGLAQLMSDPDARRTLGRAAPASVSQYGLESVADSWEALLRQAVKGGHAESAS
jgi:glycosyltransferase involved in cell wall biosynthesis